MADHTLPLRQNEATQLQFLLGLIGECTQAQTVLGKRLETTGVSSRYSELTEELGAIADRLLATVETDKLLTLRQNMLHQEMRIVTKAPADTSRYEWTLVPAEALRDLFATAAKWECGTCDGSACDMAKCAYRKTLKRLMMFDLADEGGECFARRLDWAE